ncbi:MULTISPECIES: hypothetical protein [unclassified Sphingomonas]|uniref:hypothetical protein n=1 Tax=unclassified Sphingomonas TaxID=196159 RepID=UPI0006F2E6E5|nr:MULTISPECIES: hypothetical protein [unclassified Sphingomonas]KQX19261.1 hypothetical protein ASD17_11980 [Sphingomonas sp. Root1294]KQY65465.1 hypothetical protein ASD39_15180 [Sphingomonas sp. Root50]KRB95236.1 hypothetical protein ASE22_04875 [Sphingomonas sp. Root720]
MHDLIAFERAAYGRTPDRVTRMIAVLRRAAAGRLADGAGGPGAQPGRETTAGMEAMASRLAAALAAVLADPEVEPSAREIEDLILFSGTIRQLFDIAGFGGTDFLLRLLGDIAWDAPSGQIAKRFLLLSLDSIYDWRPAMLANAPPRLGWGVLAALVATRPIATRRGVAMKGRLLEAAASMPPAIFPLDIDHLVLVSLAWMQCSYSASPHKHAIKAPLNAALRAMAAGWELEDVAPAGRRPRRDRPLLLFAAEVINGTHVQYRYFGRYLRQLRERFDLVLLTEAREADPAARALFDRVLTFERGEDAKHLHRIHRMIADTAPDIIFYPSVGMRHWGPLFANLRLAPIQMTALGHSASTFCDTIDYYLLEEGYVSDPALFGETVITLPDESLVFERPPHYRPCDPAIRAAPHPLRIAFPSNLLKLNPDFLAVIARIVAAAPRPLELHFLPNAAGLELDAGRRAIGRTLPGATVHGMLSYADYLAVLSACDLVLGPFPFGGLHSVVDSLRQGLPVVAMEGAEPHGRTDAMLLRRLGLPGWLVAANEEDYVAAALRLIADDALRIDLSEQALALDIDRLMFGDAATPLRSEVRDAVWWIHRHHEAARADGRKLWSEADRSAFDGAPSA